MQSIRIMFIDDDVVYRESVESAIGLCNGMEVINLCSTAEAAQRRLKEPGVMRLPDIILLDIHLPGISGIEAISWIRTHVADTKVIVLTTSTDPACVKKAVMLGASGYLLKSEPPEKIIQSIRDVEKGGASVDPKVGKFLLEEFQSRIPKPPLRKSLSKREMEILELLADGLVKKEIAGLLSISTSTVGAHVKNIFDKLGVTNAAAAVNRAFRLGLFAA